MLCIHVLVDVIFKGIGTRSKRIFRKIKHDKCGTLLKIFGSDSTEERDQEIMLSKYNYGSISSSPNAIKSKVRIGNIKCKVFETKNKKIFINLKHRSKAILYIRINENIKMLRNNDFC